MEDDKHMLNNKGVVVHNHLESLMKLHDKLKKALDSVTTTNDLMELSIYKKNLMASNEKVPSQFFENGKN